MSQIVLTQVQGLLNAGRLAEAKAALIAAMGRGGKGSTPMLDHAMAITLARMGGAGGEGSISQAEFYARRALDSVGPRGPGAAEFGSTLGNLLAIQGKHEKAIPVFRAALTLRPDLPGAGLGLANALRLLNQHSQAVPILRGLHERSGGADAPAAASLAATLLWMGEVHEAWDLIRAAAEKHPSDLLVATTLANIACYVPGLTTAEEHRAQRRYGEIFDRSVKITRPPLELKAPEGRPLNVGFVSPDFRAHSVGFFLAPLLSALDPAAIRPFLYSTSSADPATARFKKLVENLAESLGAFREVAHLSDHDLAVAVRADKIDVLVDLSGHTLGHRLPLFVFRAAPVQVSYLGYPSITGLSEMDARLVDNISDPHPPQGEENSVSNERLVRLSSPFLCFELPAETPAPRTPPTNHPGRPVTFGSFNTVAKINPGVLAAWAEILRGAPASRLVLKATSFADADLRETFTTRFAALGVEASRVTILPATKTRAEHLAAYSTIDLALDTFPYNGTTTTCEAAAMGVPTLTLRGDRHASRVGATINTALGLPELIATTPAEYVHAAITLANDRPRLSHSHNTLRTRLQSSPLCDAKRLAHSFTETLRALSQRARSASEG